VIDVREVQDPAERSRLCERVLRSLPEWFGIEEATAAYIRDVAELPTFAAAEDGFLSLKLHDPRAAEVYVMGVRPGRHRRGIGRALLRTAEDHLRARGVEYLQVKTLGPSREDERYARTRAFYEACGFVPLEELRGLWEGNPALVLVKRLDRVAGRARQQAAIDDFARRVESLPQLAGAVLLGSFASGEADDWSDVDFTVVVHEGRFDEAWKRRHELHPDEAACWDYPRTGEREVAGHRWLTSDVVLFDGLLATPSATRVAEPFSVLAGGDELAGLLTIREAISESEREARRGELELNEVERLYGELKLAARAARRHVPGSDPLEG
jgi:GNAT superfamily N-acetyltransferase/predicted nucleotidyltransferase